MLLQWYFWKPWMHSHSSAWSNFSSQKRLGVSQTDYCYTAVATSLWLVIKQLADDRLTYNASCSHAKNANTLLIKLDSCSLFYSPICSVFIKQQKLYSNATFNLELMLDFEAECFQDEWCSKTSIDDFRSFWQRDSTFESLQRRLRKNEADKLLPILCLFFATLTVFFSLVLFPTYLFLSDENYCCFTCFCLPNTSSKRTINLVFLLRNIIH